MQAPRTPRASVVKVSRSQANASTQQASNNHWQSIVKSLTNLLQTMRGNYVSLSLFISDENIELFEGL